MAIVHARIDERLIHGQVAMVWTNTVGATRVLVVNDEVIHDDMQLSVLKMAKPAGVKLSILSKEKAVTKIKDGAYDGDRVFLITRNVKDMVYLVENGVVDSFNIGNVAKQDGAIVVKKSVALTEDDINTLKRLVSDGHKITAQMIPTEPDCSVLEYLPK